MSLTRARVLAGEPGLRARAEAAIRDVVAASREPASVFAGVAAMRALVAREKGEGDGWNLKLAAGGLLDLDFIAQGLVLAHAHRHPNLIGLSTLGALEEAARVGLVEEGPARVLAGAYALFDEVMHWQRLTSGDGAGGALSDAALRRCSVAVGAPSAGELRARLDETRGEVRVLFAELIAPVPVG